MKLNLADPLRQHPSQGRLMLKYAKQLNGSHVKLLAIEQDQSCWENYRNLVQCKYWIIYLFIFIYNIRRIARLFPTVHYALNLRDAARNELERNMERRYDFRCRRKPKCSEKTCAGKYGSRTKFTYDSDPTGNRTRAALVKGTGTTAAPTRPPRAAPSLRWVLAQWVCKIKFHSIASEWILI